MLIVYNQSSQDVWLYDGTLTEGQFSDSHDYVPKGYSYATVATNVSVHNVLESVSFHIYCVSAGKWSCVRIFQCEE